MIDSPVCPRCDTNETLKHKLIECEYTKRIWEQVNELLNVTPTADPIKDILAIRSTGLTQLTIHSEIILRIVYLKDDLTYLIHPKTFVKTTIKDLIIKEGNRTIKNELRSLLE